MGVSKNLKYAYQTTKDRYKEERQKEKEHKKEQHQRRRRNNNQKVNILLHIVVIIGLILVKELMFQMYASSSLHDSMLDSSLRENSLALTFIIPVLYFFVVFLARRRQPFHQESKQSEVQPIHHEEAPLIPELSSKKETSRDFLMIGLVLFALLGFVIFIASLIAYFTS